MVAWLATGCPLTLLGVAISFLEQMYNKDSERDWLGEVIVASCGAGVVTTFAIARGQNPLIALGITAFAATAAILINRSL